LPLCLGVLWLLPLLGLPLLLAMLRFGLCLLVLVLLLVGVTILFVFLIVLCVYRGSNPEKQSQYGCADDSSCLHIVVPP
jgi:hypothetical protein